MELLGRRSNLVPALLTTALARSNRMIANADEMESENDVIKLQRYYVYVLRIT